MFVVAKKRLFWWPVIVRLPCPENAGVLTEATFDMQFEALAIDRAREIDAATQALPDDQKDAHRFDFLQEVARDWRDVVDENNQAIPFTHETFAAFLQLAFHRNAVLDAYTQAMSGQAARLGNSAERRAH